MIIDGFDEAQVKQTCYELRVGNSAHFLSRSETERKQAITKEKPLIVRPQEVVTIITLERICLPNFILARIISKGQLFSIGLSPVITFADPGFEGNLGITFINHSKKNIRFCLNDPISKIEFERLGKPVNKPYKGKHNYADDIWPIDASKFAKNRIIKAEETLSVGSLKSDVNFYGEPFDAFYASMRNLEKQVKRLRLINTIIILTLAMIPLFFVLQWMLNAWNILTDSMQSAVVSAVIPVALGLVLGFRENKKIGFKRESPCDKRYSCELAND